MNKLDKKLMQDELESIRLSNGGILQPNRVVEFARDPDTALHAKFQWDDGKAADEYRMWQARQVIRVFVTILPSDDEPIQAYVSLKDERPGKPNADGKKKNVDGGYRRMEDVLSDPELSAKLLSDAFYEFDRMKAKFGRLEELIPVFDAVESVRSAVVG